MKKIIIATAAIILVCFAINFAVLNAKSENTEASVQTGMKTYIIKEYEGKVACFETYSEKPFLVTEVEVINLPPIDRKMLHGGVEVVGSRALSRALEDYRT